MAKAKKKQKKKQNAAVKNTKRKTIPEQLPPGRGYQTPLGDPSLRQRARPRALTIDVSDIVNVNSSIALSEEQRSVLKRVLDKVLGALEGASTRVGNVLYHIDPGVEIMPDGTVRIGIRPRLR